MKKKRKLTKKQAKAFLATPTGQHWLERKIVEKNASRPDPGPHPIPPEMRTKYPFAATINGAGVTVWPDRIER